MGSTSEDESDLMKILWQEGPVQLPLHSDRSTGHEENETAAANNQLSMGEDNQLSMGEDELRLLLQYQIRGNEEDSAGGRGEGDICSELLDRLSTGNSYSRPMPVLTKQSVIAPTREVVGKVVESADFRKGKTRDDVLNVMGQRDRINERLKVLQELVPGSNKFDELLMLDDAIEYMKMLQLQAQIMSLMQYMGPWMLPNSQSYLATMGFTGMGMNMGMASGVDISSVAENIAHVNQLRAHATHQQDPTFNLLNVQGSNMPQIPNLAYPYRRYVGVQHPHVSAQSQSMAEPGVTKEHKINKENPDG